MASVKVGSKPDAFQKKGQQWFCTTGLPSDIIVMIGDISFHLHKFPLLSRSGVIERLIAEESGDEEGKCRITLPEIPGGEKTFELVAKFCYGVKIELTASNFVYLRCAAERLEMNENYVEGNLTEQTDNFLNLVVLRNWKDSLKALQSCQDQDVLPFADEVLITEKCIESLARKVFNNPNLFGSGLWNGISSKISSSDWWYEDASNLKLSFFTRLISAMERLGIGEEIICGSLEFYAKKYLPGLNRRHVSGEFARLSAVSISEADQKMILEEIVRLLPVKKGFLSSKFLFGLLRTASILKGNPFCVSELEKKIGLQLDEAALEDLLIPNFSYTVETLYNVDCVQSMLNHFLAADQIVCGGFSGLEDDEQLIGSPSLIPVTKVAKLIDGYLAEVAPDVNLKLHRFQVLAGAVPEYARPLDDGLYRAIDIYLKSHSWLSEGEREELCRLMDCQKLSLEACTHAAQNERLPLRIIVQVLFFEQLQLRTSIAGCLMVSENFDVSRQLRGGGGGDVAGSSEGGWVSAVRENQILKVGMDNMSLRVSELEKECLNMKMEIEKLGRSKSSSTWENVTKKFGFKVKSQMCSAENGSVRDLNNDKIEKAKDAIIKHKRNSL